MMTTKSLLFLLILVLSSFFACNSGESGSEGKSANEEFSKLAEDEQFRNAHEEPKVLSADDILGQKIMFPTEGKSGRAYLIKAAEPTDKFLFVHHEWWGLNDNILSESDRLYKGLDEKVNVIALDLYDGKVATTRDEAGKFMQGAKEERIREIIRGAFKHVGENAKVATIGWCFGGGWSLQSSILAADRGLGCVIYYGMPEMDAKKLAPLKADVLGIFGIKDQWINPKVEKQFSDVMKATGKSFESHSYEADHAFANPSGDNYAKEAAQKANEVSLEFLREKML